MAKYLLKTIKLTDNVKGGDWAIESNWIVVDSDEINQITIFDKTYVHPLQCKDCAYYTPIVDEPHKSTCQRLWGGMTECTPDSYCSDGVRKDSEDETV